MNTKMPEIPAPAASPAVMPEQVLAFAAASGDSNPIHSSADAAQSAGLPGPILHGMFIAGQFEIFLETIAGYRVKEMGTRFVRPVAVGSTLIVSARALSSSLLQPHLRLLCKTDDGVLVAIADARLEALSDPAE